MAKEKKKVNRALIASVALLFLGNVVFFLTLWLLSQYDKIALDQCLFQIKASSSGVNLGIAGGAVLKVGGFSIGLTVLEILLYRLLSGGAKAFFKNNAAYVKYCTTKACAFFKNKYLQFSITSFVICIVVFITQLNVPAYFGTTVKESDFIEDHYVDPNSVSITFPNEKRNLIYIFLESMENTFADTKAGYPITDNFIPELTALANENVSFSNTDTIGGAYSYGGTTWTASAMVAQTSGLPIKILLTSNAYGAEDGFMPGVTTIGEILAENGYNLELLVGSDADFHSRKTYFEEHGGYTIVDWIALKEQGKLPEDYNIWWGFEDEKLFAFAKEEITLLAKQDKPFNFTMLTADTHFPSGYECRLCGDEYDTQYANVLACSSKQVYEFVEWVKEQPFYDNTTIVISGDHLTMDSQFLDELDEDYVRTVYNCIINPAVTPVNEKGREFGTVDMFPTTLAAIGAVIEGDRLALGTNLFSAEKTFTELYGFEDLDIELQKNSEFYNREILAMK